MFPNNFYVFPIHRNTKRPCIKNNLADASNDPEQIKKWQAVFGDCNWGLSLMKSGLVAVDVDIKHGGMVFWLCLIASYGEPETLKAVTGSGGFHYVFKAKDAQKYRGNIVSGIDIKHNGYIVIAPSENSEGKKYQWANELPISAYPEWLELIEKKYESSSNSSFPLNYAFTTFKKCIDILKRVDLSYEQWVQAGMAIHSFDQSDIGLNLYLDLTSGQSFKEGDFETARTKWASFHKGGGISSRTLFHIIKEKGITPPRLTEKEDIEALKEMARQDFERKKIEISGFEEDDGIYKCYNKDDLVEFFNERGFAYNMFDGDRQYCELKQSLSGLHEVKLYHVRGLSEHTAPFKFAFYKDTAKGIEVKLKPAHEIWRESIKRKVVSKLVFHPEKTHMDETIFNLWAGFPMKENDVEGNPDLTLEMIFVSLCNRDERKFNWLLDWLAHIIQRPDKKPSIVPILLGEQGTGKGILNEKIMSKILGPLFIQVKSSHELVGNFNSHLAMKLLINVDEATWRGNKTEDGILKNLIGSSNLSVEEKFKGRYVIDDFARYIITSNNDEAVAIEMGNRRYCVIETGKEWANKAEKYQPLLNAIEYEAEAEKFFNFLKVRDISKFNPFMILDNNTAGLVSKIASEGVVSEFWYDVLFENPRAILNDTGLSRAKTYDCFRAFAKEVNTYERSVTPKSFWSRTIKIFPYLTSEKAIKTGLHECKRDRTHQIKNIAQLRGDFSSKIQIEIRKINFTDSEYFQNGEFQPLTKDFLQ